MKELLVWRGALNWHLEMICCTPEVANAWKAHVVGFGIAEQYYCRILNISLETLCQSPLWDSGVINLNLLHMILGFAPLGFSLQYESQQNIALKVFYVKGC